MSYVRICDTCDRSRIEFDVENIAEVEMPEGWTTDEFDRDHCNLCNAEAEHLENEIPDKEESQQFVKELKKETKKLKKAKKQKETPNVE